MLDEKKNILFTPVHIDALFLTKNKQVVAAKYDFTKLPYQSSSTKKNYDILNLSEHIAEKEFEGQNLTLKPGVHLHWSLPDALTQGRYDKKNDIIDYPAVPNRWLVTRKKRGLKEKKWIIESDYQHPEGEPNVYGSIAYPIDLQKEGHAKQPFRYFGRKIPIERWREDKIASKDFATKLTAVGYGDPTFSAFYPNCHSVFGFHDASIDKTDQLNNLEYDLLGWYSDIQDDPLFDFITNEFDYQQLKNKDTESKSNIIKETIKEEFNWITDQQSDHAIDPALNFHLFCHSKITFSPRASTANPLLNEKTDIAVGNTPNEALSALLAKELVFENINNDQVKHDKAKYKQLNKEKQVTEEQIQAIHFFHRLTNNKLDISAKFKQQSHENTFTAVDAGIIWKVITPKNAYDPLSATENTAAHSPSNHSSPPLPNNISHLLHQLNAVQQSLNKAKDDIISAQKQLYSDWQRYMMASYPMNQDQSDTPNLDAIKLYIEVKGIKKVGNEIQHYENVESLSTKKKNRLEKALQNFNQGNVESMVFFQRFDQQPTRIDEGISFNGSRLPLTENLPFSKTALSANGTDFWLNVKPPGAIQAVSMWVYINGHQPSKQACLIKLIDESMEVHAEITTSGFSNNWAAIHIDGAQISPYRNKNWLDIPKDRWVHLYLELSEKTAAPIYLLSQDTSNHFLKAMLASIRLFDKPLSEDDIYTDRNMLKTCTYDLQPVASGRYWQPNEPVVLLAGKGVKATERHSSDGLLPCQLATIEGQIPPVNERQLIAIQTKNTPTSGIANSIWEHQPWNPFMLEWKAEVFPLSYGNNINQYHSKKGRHYDPEFIQNNFYFVENSSEFSLKPHRQTGKSVSIYTGRSILTPHAKINLINSINRLLSHLKPSDLYQITNNATEQHKDTYETEFNEWFNKKELYLTNKATEKEELTAKNINAFEQWYIQKPVYQGPGTTHDHNGIQRFPKHFEDLAEKDKKNNLIYTAILAYKKVQNSHFLAQSLGGFNASLLMQKQSMQLPIADPLGFGTYVHFTDLVKKYVGKESKVSPLVHQDFNPFRSGTMNLLKLNLIDTFGQVKSNFNEKSFTTLEKLKAPDRLKGDTERDHIMLSPAFTQPVRLNLRWLSAQNGEQEMNSHPASNPICGWLLPNNLDHSIMVYDRHGQLLGLINVQAQWEPAPGSDCPLSIETLPNDTLKKVVVRLTNIENANTTESGEKTQELSFQAKRDFLQDFISVLDIALENIDPENFAQHQELALLIGRPIAITRVSVDLQLKGQPALNQSWNSLRKAMAGSTPNTDGFEHIKTPIRVGDRKQLNDGVIGFWKETESQYLEPNFHTTVSQTIETNPSPEHKTNAFTHTNIKAYEAGFSAIEQTLVSPPQTLTLLIDPRAKIHATTGILPTKAIDLPPDQYEHAFKKMAVTFLSTPIITGPESMDIPLPDEPGYRWKWLQKERDHWNTLSTTGTLSKDSLLNHFGHQGIPLWEELKRAGWIQETDKNTAHITPINHRKEKTLSNLFLQDIAQVEAALDYGHISTIETQAVFPGKPVIKEGWLQLSPTEKDN